MKHESANADPLNGQSVDVMNSSFALIFRNIQICTGVGSLCLFRLKIFDLSQDSAAEESYGVGTCCGFIPGGIRLAFRHFLLIAFGMRVCLS